MSLANVSAFRPCEAPKSLAEADFLERTILCTADTLKNNLARLNVASFSHKRVAGEVPAN